MVFEARVVSRATEGTTAPATVVVFDGDPIVGRALELLLQTSDYGVRYVAESSFLSQPGALDGVRVLLLGPGWNAKSREALMKVVKSMPPKVRIPVLEVGLPTDDTRIEPECYVPWPCRAEDLKRRIDAVLLAELHEGKKVGT